MSNISYFLISFSVTYLDGKFISTNDILAIDGYGDLSSKDKATMLNEEILMYRKINFGDQLFCITNVFEIK